MVQANILMIIKEPINNVVKYSEATIVSIAVKKINNTSITFGEIGIYLKAELN